MNTPSSELAKIVITGIVNAGKSSLINSIFEREISIVAPVVGTTTDAVTKRIELASAGPVTVVDTAGLDDKTELGALRIKKTLHEIETADIIILATPLNKAPTATEDEILLNAERQNKQILICATFADLPHDESKIKWLTGKSHIRTDNKETNTAAEIRKKLITAAGKAEKEITPLEGIVHENDHILLAVPLDLAAPKGRLILPQIETIRDALDRDCTISIAKDRELKQMYDNLVNKPDLVITDSQTFSKTAADIDSNQKLTSFSILFARKKGDLSHYLKGLGAISKIQPKSKVMIVESCSHHKQPDDIGTVKIPRLFRQMIQSDTEFVFAHGLNESDDYTGISAAIICGGCMQTRRQMLSHLRRLEENNIPVTNYGIFLAYVNGLLPRAIEVFPDEYELYIETMK